jgi:uncharacterized membrane protein
MAFILLQVPTTEYVQKAFDITPDTVLGLLVAGMAIVIAALAVAIGYVFKKYISLVEQAVMGQVATAERLEAIEHKLNQ